MKKAIFLLIALLCTVSLVYAITTIIIHDTVRPKIEATFNESVTINNYNLSYTATGQEIKLNYTTPDKTNKTFIFTPKKSLVNGYYFFIVNAHDRIGNPKEFKRNVIIDVNKTDIFYSPPPLFGIAAQQTFNLVLGTNRDSICRWTTDPMKTYLQMLPSSFTQTGNGVHSINPFPAPQDIEKRQDEIALPKIYMACNDSFGFIVKKTMAVGYDTSAPVFSVSVAGLVDGKVIGHPPTATIKVSSDDRVFCTAKKNSIIKPFNGQSRLDRTTYSTNPQYTANWTDDVSSNGNYQFDITCENLANTPVTKSVTIAVALTQGLTITVQQPKPFISGELVYDIVANKAATTGCTAQLDGNASETLTPDTSNPAYAPKTHFTLLHGRIPDGSHKILFECTSDIESKTLLYSFAVDTTPPTIPQINATACAKDKISLAFSSNDSNSGIAGFNYTVYSGANITIPWKFTPNSKVDESNIKPVFVDGITYTVDAIVFNKAGLSAKRIPGISFLFSPNTTIACQEKNKPVIKLNISNTPIGKQVNIICTDESGCESVKYGLSDTSNCTATIVGTIAIIQKTQTLCWEAADKWGNTVIGSKVIPFKAFGNTCSNSFLDGTESDVDCGGSCLGCQVGLKCKNNSDCADNYCVSGICKRPLCTDTLKNGFETDIDCGGSLCAGCAIGKSCMKSSDCASNFCNNQSICAATSCTDNAKNGFETDVDCGGTACGACEVGKSCIKDSDCKSNKCEFSTCAAGEETFEQWAARNNIDPTDKDGDPDGDGLSNYQEYLNHTDPHKADTDEDGYSDGAEIKANTDPLDPNSFPSSNLYRYLLLGIGILILVIGALLMYYFHADAQASVSVMAVGGVALLIALIDWLFTILPSWILMLASAGAIGVGGYFMYTQKKFIIEGLSKQKITGFAGGPAKAGGAPKMETVMKGGVPSAEPSARKEDLTATQQMIEMIKREKESRGKRREQLFSSFAGGKPEIKSAEKPLLPISKPKTKVIAKKPERVTPVTQKTAQVSPAPKTEKEKEAFDRLSEFAKSKGVAMDELAKIIPASERAKRKEEAFEKLSKMSKSKLEDLFSKLPESGRGTEDLEELEKRRKKKR